MLRSTLILISSCLCLQALALDDTTDVFYEKSVSESQASFFDIMPGRGGQLSNVVIDSQVKTATVGSYTSLNLHLSCYATNLRNVANPVTANSLVIALVDITTTSGAKTLRVEFPAEFLKPEASRMSTDAIAKTFIKTTGIANVKFNAKGNTIQLLLPDIIETTIMSNGEISNVTQKNMIASGVRFAQGPIPETTTPTFYGSYFGSSGPLSSAVNWYTSKDGKTIDVYAAFPGAATIGMRAQYQGETRTGFCGGYYSPIMLFFSDDLPSFTGRSKFSLSKDQPGQIFWPEANSPGYFLVLDKNKDSKIVDGSQMFGDNEKFADGFQNLASHDLNKDRVIDKKDAVFKDLKLWNDQNGDGISQKNELRSLQSLNVSSLDLKIHNETVKFGDRAEYKQKSIFKFKRDGKIQKGLLIDMWFSPALQ